MRLSTVVKRILSFKKIEYTDLLQLGIKEKKQGKRKERKKDG